VVVVVVERGGSERLEEWSCVDRESRGWLGLGLGLVLGLRWVVLAVIDVLTGQLVWSFITLGRQAFCGSHSRTGQDRTGQDSTHTVAYSTVVLA
jgi:hypothetical protein